MPMRRRVAVPGARYSRIWYRSVPGCVGHDGSVAKLASSQDRLTSGHRDAIDLAARYPTVTHIENAHSPGVLMYLEASDQERVLPEPSAAQDAAGRKLYPEDFDSEEEPTEGSRQSTCVNRCERSRIARERCIEHYGARCSVCDMSFGERYGKVLEGFIHVHHLKPMSEVGRQYRVNPVDDLRPVCMNCHAVIHAYRKGKALSIAEAQRRIQKRRQRA